jgi:P-type Cu2+ transporter
MPAEPALGLLTAILGLALGVYIGSFSNEDRFTKGRQEIAVVTADIVLVRTNPLDVTSILGLARATYLKMVQNLGWATGYNVVAIPVAAGVLYTYGIVLVPAVGTMLMLLSTVIVAINSRF